MFFLIKVLEILVRRRKQVKLLRLFGRIDFDPEYDSKKQRRADPRSSR